MTENKVVHKEAKATQPKEDEDDYYNDIPPPPDGGYGWVIVAASFFCNMVVDGIAYTFGIFLTQIVDDYKETKGKTAWVGSLLTGMCMCVGPLVSALANKFGCRTACIVGSLISTAAFIVSTFCPSVNWLMLVYGFIGGTGFGLIYLPAVVCVGYYFESKRSLATGIAVCGSGVGTFAFAPFATFLLETYGWRGANLILAGVIFNCVIFGALMRPLEYPSKKKVQATNKTTNHYFDEVKMVTKPTKAVSHDTLTVPVIETRRRADSTGAFLARNIVDVESSAFTSKQSHFVQPMARKDIFYSGSIANLREFQSQRSLASYRHSIMNISHIRSGVDMKKSENNYIVLLKSPVFMFIAVSSVFGMAALYVPFVYLVDCAQIDGIENASFILSIIGITNTIARIVCGYIADFPKVNALFVNNCCIVIAAISVGLMPFCHTYLAYAIISIFFAIAVAGYISLSSIILVDLLGLDKLTDAFGLLILFRGAAALVGSPLAGALYDATQSYDIPFFVASALFAISAVISFLVPCVQDCTPQDVDSKNDEVLTPINQKEIKT